jgi:hypothetical protein
MKALIAFLIVMAIPAVAYANDPHACRFLVAGTPSAYTENLIDGLALTSDRTFTWDTNPRNGGYDLMTVWATIEDADSTITRIDLDCEVSRGNGSTHYYKIQFETVAAGTATQVDSGAWEKAVSGSASWPYRIDIEGFFGGKCTISAAAGTAGAADKAWVRVSVCATGK